MYASVYKLDEDSLALLHVGTTHEVPSFILERAVLADSAQGLPVGNYAGISFSFDGKLYFNKGTFALGIEQMLARGPDRVVGVANTDDSGGDSTPAVASSRTERTVGRFDVTEGDTTYDLTYGNAEITSPMSPVKGMAIVGDFLVYFTGTGLIQYTAITEISPTALTLNQAPQSLGIPGSGVVGSNSSAWHAMATYGDTLILSHNGYISRATISISGGVLSLDWNTASILDAGLENGNFASPAVAMNSDTVAIITQGTLKVTSYTGVGKDIVLPSQGGRLSSTLGLTGNPINMQMDDKYLYILEDSLPRNLNVYRLSGTGADTTVERVYQKVDTEINSGGDPVSWTSFTTDINRELFLLGQSINIALGSMNIGATTEFLPVVDDNAPSGYAAQESRALIMPNTTDLGNGSEPIYKYLIEAYEAVDGGSPSLVGETEVGVVGVPLLTEDESIEIVTGGTYIYESSLLNVGNDHLVRVSYGVKDDGGEKALFMDRYSGAFTTDIHFVVKALSETASVSASAEGDSEASGDSSVNTTEHTATTGDIDFIGDSSSTLRGFAFSLPRALSGNYNVYVSLNNEPFYLLKEGLSQPLFRDRGSSATGDVDVTRTAPRHNATNIPDAKFGVSVRGRMLLYGDEEHPSRVYYGGFDKKVFDFTPTIASGYVDVTSSSDEKITSVVPFYGQADSYGIAVFTSTEGNTLGKEYFLAPLNTQLANGLVVSGFSVQEVGRTGAEGFYNVVNYQDNMYRPSVDGFKVKGPRPTLQHLLLTEDISQTIRKRTLNLSQKQIADMVGTNYKQKIYWSVPEWNRDNEGNEMEAPDDPPNNFNKIWVLNLTQGEGSWICDWNIKHDYIYTHVGDNKQQLMLIVQGDKILKYVDNDYSGLFLPKVKSARLFTPNRQYDEAQKIAIMALVRPWFIISDLKGRIKITVWGRTEDNIEGELGTIEVGSGDTVTTSGQYGEFIWGKNAYGEAPPEVIKGRREDGSPVYYIPVDLEENLALWFGFTIEALTPYTNFVLNDLVYTYKYAGPAEADEGLEISESLTTET